LRPYQVATAAVIILIAAVAMFDTRSGALPDPSGTAPGGLRGGWYPFWSAALMAAAALVVAYSAIVLPQPSVGVFRDRRGVLDVLRLVLPLIALVLLMDPGIGRLGFYISGAAYVAFFARVIGGYSLPRTIALTLAIPIVTYVAFELGFRLTLPRSFLFELGLPF
jgi:hypothetical protein